MYTFPHTPPTPFLIVAAATAVGANTVVVVAAAIIAIPLSLIQVV